MKDIFILRTSIVTLQGLGRKGVADMLPDAPVESAIVRPKEIANKILRIDYASGLCASATIEVVSSLARQVSKDRIGIIVCTTTGNLGVVREYVQRINRNRNSPSYYAASGYNICAGVAAMATGIHGATIVCGGKNTSLADALVLASNYLQRKEIDVMCVNCVDVNIHHHNVGACLSFALALETDCPNTISLHVSLKHNRRENEQYDNEMVNQKFTPNNYTYFEEKLPVLSRPLRLWEICNSTAQFDEHRLSFKDSAMVDHILIRKEEMN
jgi:hypothetical protein